MNYKEYLILVEETKNYETPVEARLEYGFPPDCEWTGNGLARAFDIIFAVSRNDISELIKISGLRSAVFGRKFDIPVRTVQSWASEMRCAPEYAIKLLGFAMLSECEKEQEL